MSTENPPSQKPTLDGHESQKDTDSIDTISFTNGPRLSGLESDKNFDDIRLELVPKIKTFLESHELFKDKTLQVTFATQGVSSLVSIIESPEGKTILKIPLGAQHARGESQFLQKWQEAGVKVPTVYEQGTLGTHDYMLMEYVDAPLLSETFSEEEKIEKNIYLAMGETLKLMHRPEASGYGHVVDGSARYSTFTEWIDADNMKKRFEYAHTHSLFSESDGTFEEIKDVLISHAESNPQSSYCHDDFGGANIFATDPLTVFDPNPRFNNGYIDLGRSLMIYIATNSKPDAIAQMLEGYFKDEPYDTKALHASIALAAFMKAKYWHQTKRFEQLRRIQRYLQENHGRLKI